MAADTDAYESDDVHVLELAQAVNAARRLDLVGRIQAGLEEVEPRRRRERDPDRAGPQRHDEHFGRLFELLEVADRRVALRNGRRARELEHREAGLLEHRADGDVRGEDVREDDCVQRRLRLPQREQVRAQSAELGALGRVAVVLAVRALGPKVGLGNAAGGGWVIDVCAQRQEVGLRVG